MQIRVSRAPRGERPALSCGECRRRKQKCNQAQPCSNCARRFPQPTCEYNTNGRRLSTSWAWSQPASSVPAMPEARTAQPSHPLDEGISQMFLDPRQVSSDVLSGESGQWSGIDIKTQYPAAATLGPWGNSWTSAPGSLSPAGLPACDENCTRHSDAIHDAVRLLQLGSAVPSQHFHAQWHPDRTDEILTWLVEKQQQWLMSHSVRMPDGREDMAHLPSTGTRSNAELLQIFVKLLCRFKACLDGNPDASNRYINLYVPFCIQTPLLAQIAVYTAACFLNETGHVDKTVVMSHKGLAISMLNEHLRAESATSDEAVAGVMQLIMDEWYWGDVHDLKAHLRGLREMIRLRGGFQCLGLDGVLAKLVISSDVAIALSFEARPFIGHGSDAFQDPAHTSARLVFNTPFLTSLPSFATCSEALNLHPAAARILDDMRFLIRAVLACPSDSEAAEARKIQKTAAWIHERISALPPRSPAGMGLAMSVDPSDPSVAEHAAQQPRSSSSSNHSTTASSSSGHALLPQPLDQSDITYEAIRQAALIYSQTIVSRQPFSVTVTPQDFSRLWTTMWRVPLSTWKAMLGVFGWVVLCITPSARSTPHDRFVKSMLTISLVQASLEGWGTAEEVMRAAVGLQTWLGKGRRGGETP